MSYNEQVYKENILKSFGKDNYYACLSKVDQSEIVLQSVHKWISDKSNILFFAGNPGLGKSYLSSAICNYLIDQKKNFRCFTEKMFLNHLRMGISSGIDSEFEIMRLCEVEYFIMDDIGSAKNMNDWQVEQIFSFLDQRATSRKPTMITSNLFSDEMKGIFTPRFVSRLLDHRNVVIEMNGTDKRIYGAG